MKNFIAAVLIVFLLMFSVSCSKKSNVSENLVIYAYDSFISEWGPGPKVFPLFEEKTGIKTEIVSPGDAGQVLSRLILEKEKPEADIVIGIDNNMAEKAISAGILEKYTSGALSKIDDKLVFDKSGHITPYDYGFFSIIYDSEKISVPPSSLDDLLDKSYSKSIILMDPRTSGPGLGFLLWTVKAYGDDFIEYWKKLSPNILTITEGWDSGYGLFVNGEAPMVLSYTTSPAYHLEYENSEKYKAAVFKNGNYMHIEGAAIVKGSKKRKEAEKFIDFILSDDFQKELPLTNWMFPVRDIPLPDSYRVALKPETYLLFDSGKAAENIDSWIKEWLTAVRDQEN